MTMIFTNLADHFQVVEQRALFLWNNNEHLVKLDFACGDSSLNAQAVLPIQFIIYGPLMYKNSSGHWNVTVAGLDQNVLKMYMELAWNTIWSCMTSKCTVAYFRDEDRGQAQASSN
jgi:hypothetical protein